MSSRSIRRSTKPFTGESLFVPRGGETWSNLCNPTPLNPETFRRAIAEMKRQSREPMRPRVLLVPPDYFEKWQAILAEMPPGFERERV